MPAGKFTVKNNGPRSIHAYHSGQVIALDPGQSGTYNLTEGERLTCIQKLGCTVTEVADESDVITAKAELDKKEALLRKQKEAEGAAKEKAAADAAVAAAAKAAAADKKADKK